MAAPTHPTLATAWRSWASDLAAVIVALDLRPPAVLGHSLGAATALVLAGAYPNLPGAILLEDPAPWWAEWAQIAGGEAFVTELRARFIRLKSLAREARLAEQRASQPGWSEAELADWADARQQFDLDVRDILDPNFPPPSIGPTCSGASPARRC